MEASVVAVVEGRVTINQSVVSAELDEELVLLNVETGIYFGLDAIGSKIWKALERGASEDEVVAELLDEYDVGLAQARKDVSEFLAALHEQGLVRLDGS